MQQQAEIQICVNHHVNPLKQKKTLSQVDNHSLLGLIVHHGVLREHIFFLHVLQWLEAAQSSL